VPFKILDIGSGRTPAQQQIQPEDKAFVFVAPQQWKWLRLKTVRRSGERPFVIFNPRLEDVSVVGIGYAARQVRLRFINTIESCYHIRPLDGAALFRCYPFPWQVWLETDSDYRMIAELPKSQWVKKLTKSSLLQSHLAPHHPKGRVYHQSRTVLRTLSR
jgi:hypothetical protein